MTQCQNCGQFNNGESNFCRFCGTKMVQTEMQPQSYEYNPPRPYIWKTDEFQVQDARAGKNRQINQVQPLTNQTSPAQSFRPQPMSNYRQGQMNYGYRCPHCGTQNFPRVERKISTAGWIVFAVLLLVFFPFFWIGFLIKEEVKICPVCNFRVS